MPSRSSKTAVGKRDSAAQPHVKTLTDAKGSNYPPGRMLIASPLAVQDEVATVPAGRVITAPQLRARLARRFGADYTCPITTGIFLRIVAEAALEEARAGEVPVWRVVSENGALLDKLPGGPERQAARLTAEGVAVVRRRSRWFVDDLAHVAMTG
ncbi:MAG: MGMT family protein [Gemmatimonas sp.]|uniref:MGMT family protein n=1 Tax=Gemmatimonas sp. TaxID=1962908 RepID=UPI0022C95592|nr:MGMT family protein [Gemmatimonas sp.]MCZ8011451.1 MGMT family protein [Gemmatimonas sp.]MCZ8267938.1 MGMT family protein [Gemmatimonas sp.]